MTQKNIISFFLRHPDFFIGIISRKYPFTKGQLEKYKDFLDWGKISNNLNIIWTFEIMETFKNSIDWVSLTTNENAFKDRSLLDAFSDKIDWFGGEFCDDSIASNVGLVWDIDLILKYESKIDFDKLSENTAVLWSEELIDKFMHKWDLVSLGCNNSIPWTLHLFKKYLDESYFLYFPIKNNYSLIGTIEFVDRYKNQLDWFNVCRNPKLPWIEKKLLEYWSNYIDWNGISNNGVFFLNDKNFFNSHYDKWEMNNIKSKNSLSQSEFLPWSKSFIETYKDFWDWERLCTNKAIPWSIDLIDYFSNYIQWGGLKPGALVDDKGEEISQFGGLWYESGLVDNELLPWSIEFLLYYEKEIELKTLEMNNAVWEKAFKHFVDKELLETVMRLL